MKPKSIIFPVLGMLILVGCGQVIATSTMISPSATVAPSNTPTPSVQQETDGLSITPDNTADVELLRTVTQDRGRVWTMAFSGDGIYFAWKDQNSLNVEELAGGVPDFTFSLPEMDLNSFAFSPDSRLLASAQTIWDIQSRQVLHKLSSHGRLHPAFSPDGAWLAVSGVQPIQIWDVASGQLVRTFDTTADIDSFSLAFSPDGMLLADSGHNGRITFWDIASGREVRTFGRDAAANDVHDIAFSPDGRLLVSVGTDSIVRLWGVADGQLLNAMFHNNGLYGVAFSPDGRLVASASCDRTVKLWEVASGRLMNTLRHADEVTSVVFSPDGALLASSGYDQKIYFWGIPR